MQDTPLIPRTIARAVCKSVLKGFLGLRAKNNQQIVKHGNKGERERGREREKEKEKREGKGSERERAQREAEKRGFTFSYFSSKTIRRPR